MRRRTAGLIAAALGALGLAAGIVSPLGAQIGAVPAHDFRLAGALSQGGWARGIAPAGTAALTLDGKPVRLAEDRSFFLAFDRDAPSQSTLIATRADETAVRQTVAIARRAWQIEHIPVGPKPGTPPDPEYAKRRAGELARIAAARRLDHPAPGWRQSFVWPLKGRISGRFGAQRIYNGVPGAYHSGTDIATGTSGTPFVAPADGVVILAAADAPFSLEGKLLMIDHGMGLNSAFLHCSKLVVKEGDVVRQGQYLGNIGMTGRTTGPHLHWSIKWRDARLDPQLFAGAMAPR